MLARIVVVVASLAACAFAVQVEPAAACSCAPVDPRSALAEADGAFVGRLVSKRAISDQEAIYTFRVDESVKGKLGETVEVRSAIHGATCGIEVDRGRLIGLFLERSRDVWRSGLCWQVAPAELRAAARPLPRPNGAGAATLLVGGRLGHVRTLTLDGRARTLRYGRGGGEANLLAACPGGHRAAELAYGVGPRVFLLGVRDLRTMRLRERGLRLRGYAFPHELACAKADGSELLLFSTDDSERLRGSARIWRIDGRGARALWRGTATAAAFRGGTAFVASGRALIRVDLRTRRSQRVARLPASVGALSVSPDGSRVAAITDALRVNKVVVVDAGTGRVRAASLGRPGFGDQVLWWRHDRVVFFAQYGAQSARVYDTSLRVRARFDRWNAAEAAIVGDRAFGIRGGTIISVRLTGGRVVDVRRLPGPALNKIVALR